MLTCNLDESCYGDQCCWFQGVNYCTRAWGVRLRARVAQLAKWAERQGLELAASCHLGRLAEAAYLLEVCIV